MDPTRVIVRVNAATTAKHAADIEMHRGTNYRMLVLPRAERASQLAPLAGWNVVALCETPGGILNAAQIASTPNVIVLMWGAEDSSPPLAGARAGALTDATVRWQCTRAQAF
jgi:citrate lyase subunit beta/citryl-CoA lyase